MIRRNVRFLLCLFAIILPILSACSGEGIINEISTAQSFSLSGETMTESRSVLISVSDSATATLNAGITHKNGSLSVLISDANGDVIYSGSDIASATSFILLLEGPADYTISIHTDRFSGSCSFQWEIVGGSLPEPEVSDNNQTDCLSAEPEADQAASTEVIITNTPAIEPIPEIPEDSTEDTPAFVPEWNGRFENSDIASVIDLYWIDSNSIEFQINCSGSVLTAAAQIDEQYPDTANYTYGEELELSFRLTPSGLIVTQTGTSALFETSVAGEYLPVPEQTEP